MTDAVQASHNEIGVVGMACLFPGAASLSQYLENIREGRVATKEHRSADGNLEYPDIPAKGVVEGKYEFDNGFFKISSREAALMDPQHRLALQVTWHAVEDAGLSSRDLTSQKVGIYATSNVSAHRVPALEAANSPAERFIAHFRNVSDCLAGALAYSLDTTGETVGVQTACSSSLAAAVLACRALRCGVVDTAIVTGVSIMPTDELSYRYQPGMIYSPSGVCRPFDHEADGMIEGEGVGTIVLQRLDVATGQGRRVRASILGGAIGNDGRAKAGFAAPSAVGQAQVIQEALADAGMRPQDVGFLETHGTGTSLGDAVELATVVRAYGPRLDRLVLGAGKGGVGHLIQAAGIAALIKTVLCVQHSVLPPIPNFRMQGSVASPEWLCLPTSARAWDEEVRVAAVSSFGIGGTNVHVILRSHIQEADGSVPVGAQVLVLSARSAEVLARMKASLAAWLARNPSEPIAAIASTLAFGRTHLSPYRWAAIVETHAEAIEELNRESRLSLPRSVIDWLNSESMDPPPGVVKCRNVDLPLYPFECNLFTVSSEKPVITGPAAGHDPADDILAACRRELGLDEVSLDDNLYGLGADSLTILDLWLACRPSEQDEMPIASLMTAATPREILAIFSNGGRNG